MADWLKRPYEPKDESGVLYLWLKSYAYSRYGRARGAEREHTEGERNYWREHAPMVEYLLKRTETTLAVDPEEPGVIWGFACTSGDTVHYMVVKRSVLRLMGSDFAGEMMRDLLDGRMERACGTTHELPWKDCGLTMPEEPAPNGRMRPRWHLDTTWFGRQLIAKRAA